MRKTVHKYLFICICSCICSCSLGQDRGIRLNQDNILNYLDCTITYDKNAFEAFVSSKSPTYTFDLINEIGFFLTYNYYDVRGEQTGYVGFSITFDQYGNGQGKKSVWTSSLTNKIRNVVCSVSSTRSEPTTGTVYGASTKTSNGKINFINLNGELTDDELNVLYPDGNSSNNNSDYSFQYTDDDLNMKRVTLSSIFNKLSSINVPASTNSLRLVTQETTVTAIGDGIRSLKQFPNAAQNTVKDEGYIVNSINLPETIAIINAKSFYNFTSLRSVNIPSSCTYVGSYAFQKCSSLNSINLPNSINTIGEGCFTNSGIASIRIPSSVKKIGSNVFSGCTNNLVINCEATSKPSGWDSKWNYSIGTNSYFKVNRGV